MMKIAAALQKGRRYLTAPLTVIKDLDTPLSRRRPAEKRDVFKMLDSAGVDTVAGIKSIATYDDYLTYDQQTRDSAGVFLVGELERLDQRLHMPLAAVTWQEDIDLRNDVSIADEFSSYTNSAFAQASGVAGSNKNWITKDDIAIPAPGLDIGKTVNPLTLWGSEVSWTLPELLSAQQLGRPVDTQKYDAMQLKYQMDVDEQVYMGDTALGVGGMLNHPLMTNTGNAVTGNWSTATPVQMLGDINAILSSLIGSSAMAVMPNKVLISWPDMAILTSTLISSAGNISVLRFLLMNNIVRAAGQPLDIEPRKWLLGTSNTFGGFQGQGPAATNTMFAYHQAENRIRIPIVPLLRTPLEWRGLRQITTYYGRIGAVELVYPETAAIRSGID